MLQRYAALKTIAVIVAAVLVVILIAATSRTGLVLVGGLILGYLFIWGIAGLIHGLKFLMGHRAKSDDVSISELIERSDGVYLRILKKLEPYIQRVVENEYGQELLLRRPQGADFELTLWFDEESLSLKSTEDTMLYLEGQPYGAAPGCFGLWIELGYEKDPAQDERMVLEIIDGLIERPFEVRLVQGALGIESEFRIADMEDSFAAVSKWGTTFTIDWRLWGRDDAVFRSPPLASLAP